MLYSPSMVFLFLPWRFVVHVGVAVVPLALTAVHQQQHLFWHGHNRLAQIRHIAATSLRKVYKLFPLYVFMSNVGWENLPSRCESSTCFSRGSANRESPHCKFPYLWVRFKLLSRKRNKKCTKGEFFAKKIVIRCVRQQDTRATKQELSLGAVLNLIKHRLDRLRNNTRLSWGTWCNDQISYLWLRLYRWHI